MPTLVTRTDVCFFLGASPPASTLWAGATERLTFTSSMITVLGEPAFKLFASETGTHLVYSDGTEFWLDARGANIWCVWPEALTLDDAAAYLLGPVLGLLLRLRGIVCLHGSGVVIRDRAVLFLGESGSGKSTTAAAMAHRGHKVLADDIVAIFEERETYLASPGHPYLSLWPESVGMVYGPGAERADLKASSDKLRSFAHSFQETSVRLGQIFILGARSADDTAPRIEGLPEQEKLLGLVVNSYATAILDSEKRAKEFELFGRLIKALDVQRLLPHFDPARLDRLCGTIEQACASS
jgi:hypothetical protein